MKEIIDNFIQSNSPDGGFLQSEEWRKFQESYGQRTFNFSADGFWANAIEHKLKLVGNYFYIPRGPILCHPELVSGAQGIPDQARNDMRKIIELAKKEKVGWIRIEPANEDILSALKQNLNYKIIKAPHDVQPKEIFVINITKSEEELLSGMKSKTRYNIKLAEKKGVKIKIIDSGKDDGGCFEEFLRLVRITAERNEISAHPEEYYFKMWKKIPVENLKLYVAEFEGKIIAANLILFFGQVATYLHGASDNQSRPLMAPYLLQWQAIKDAKSAGCEKYDFGGISTNYESNTNIRITNKFAGITKFKLGFSPNTLPINFPGSYDIILDSKRYYLYKLLHFLKNIF